MSVDREPHEELGVPADATFEEIHRAFRRLLRVHHPDTRREGSLPDPASDQALQRVVTAYQSLRDRHGQHPTGGSSPAPPRPDERTPPLRATPVSWAPAGPAAGAPTTRAQAGTGPSLEALIRWLLDDPDRHRSARRTQ